MITQVFWDKYTPKNKFACNGAAEKVSFFKTDHAPTASPKVYGPTPFTPLSPASMVGMVMTMKCHQHWIKI